jgi:hypothetical protein
MNYFDAMNLCALIILYLFRILYPFFLDPISVNSTEPNVALYIVFPVPCVLSHGHCSSLPPILDTVSLLLANENLAIP